MAANAPFTFDLQTKMTSDQAITEMHSKTASSAHPHKSVMQAMICIAMAYETVCSTARSAAAAAAHVGCVFYCHLKTYCGPSSETMQSPE